MSLTTRDFLAEAVLDKVVIDRFLNSEAGMVDSLVMYGLAPTGER